MKLTVFTVSAILVIGFVLFGATLPGVPSDVFADVHVSITECV